MSVQYDIDTLELWSKWARELSEMRAKIAYQRAYNRLPWWLRLFTRTP